MKTIISNIEWKLPEFNAIYLASFNSIQLKSYRFYISECDSLAWELCLEFNRQKNNNVNIWLCQIGPDRINGPVNTKYKIYAIKDGESLEIAKSTYKFEYQEKLGFTEIEFKKLMSFDGKLSFYCEVLADYNFIDNLKDTYMDIFEKEIFTDCVIKVGDEIIKTHRCVLAKNSEVFRKMFEQKGMTETQN
uniref:BTB domain-containing protein n=1 Tax=Meloidogyne hapla TaxID=6305 RepID=A0A1I8C3J6_MELHA